MIKKIVSATLGIGVLALLNACSNDPVTLSQEQWLCEGKQCEVSFVLNNAGPQAAIAHYAVRAQNAVPTIGSDMTKGLVVAEIKESIELQAGETKTITHEFKAARPPSNVSFKAWVK